MDIVLLENGVKCAVFKISDVQNNSLNQECKGITILFFYRLLEDRQTSYGNFNKIFYLLCI